jgi:hypothetical protein
MTTAGTEGVRNMLIWDFTRHLARRVHSLNKSSVTDEGMSGAIAVFYGRFARVPKHANITYMSLKPEGRELLRCVRRGSKLSITTAVCYNILYCRKYSVFLFMA